MACATFAANYYLNARSASARCRGQRPQVTPIWQSRGVARPFRHQDRVFPAGWCAAESPCQRTSTRPSLPVDVAAVADDAISGGLCCWTLKRKLAILQIGVHIPLFQNPQSFAVGFHIS
jgi:hypothetical protein